MHRKLLALSISFALALVGVQPGVASMISASMNMDQMSMGHGDMENMAMDHMSMSRAPDKEVIDHSCCPDHDPQAPCDGNCAMSWLACAIHCGFAAPVFLSLQEFQAWRSYRGEGEPPGVFLGLTSIDASPPFHPPKRSVRV